MSAVNIVSTVSCIYVVLVKKEGMVGDSSSAVANPNGNGGRGGGAPAFHNESFSDDDDHYNLSSHTMADDVVDPKAKFNRSWIR